MALNSFDVVFFTIGFLTPGLVWSTVLAMLVPARTAPVQIRLLEFLTLSCINYGLWSWLLFAMFKSGFVERYPLWSGWLLFGIVFVSPVALGTASGWLHQRDAVARFLISLGLRTVHPIPRAWDWHFSHEKPYWVQVTLKNGARIYGFFGTRSFAASDPNQRDLYVESQFRRLDNGEWAPLEDTGGVLIMADQISAIEFRKVTEVSYDG